MAKIKDTERLEFMLKKPRNVVIERCFSHIEVYVEEGVMSDRKYSPVHITQQISDWTEEDRLCYQRQAIDLAIIETKVQTNEKSN